jgi:hypothetical protein
MSNRIKFIYGVFSDSVLRTLRDAVSMFLEIETDMAMGDLREHTRKRSAVKEELVDQFSALFGMNDFMQYISSYNENDPYSISVDGDVLLKALRRYRDMTMVGFEEALATEKAECIRDFTNELYNLTILIERVKLWCDQPSTCQE